MQPNYIIVADYTFLKNLFFHVVKIRQKLKCKLSDLCTPSPIGSNWKIWYKC